MVKWQILAIFLLVREVTYLNIILPDVLWIKSYKIHSKMHMKDFF